MVSKKVLGPALTGTGAVGATGSLAWALGLFDGEGLNDIGRVEDKKETLDSKVDKPTAKSSAPLQGSSGGGWVRQVITSLKIPGAVAISDYFTKGTATEGDKQAIKETLTWKVEWLSGFESLWVKVVGSENSTLWECRLRHTSIKKIDSEDKSNSELLRQGGDLIEAMKINSNKEKFVENCSKAKGGGETYGVIELEVEKDSKGKVMFKESNGYFQKLWTEDFTGLDKLLSSDDEKLLKEITGWRIEETKEESGKTGKIKISLENNKDWFCNISGNFKGNLGTKKFKEEVFIDEILDSNRNNTFQNEVEWKKYLFRNCKKHNKEITGLTVQAAGSNEWEFSDLKKITEDIYPAQ